MKALGRNVETFDFESKLLLTSEESSLDSGDYKVASKTRGEKIQSILKCQPSNKEIKKIVQVS